MSYSPPRRFAVGQVVIAADLNQMVDNIEAVRAGLMTIEEARRAQAEPVHAPVSTTGLVAAGLVAVGSSRTVSRRSLLGLGLFRRRS